MASAVISVIGMASFRPTGEAVSAGEQVGAAIESIRCRQLQCL